MLVLRRTRCRRGSLTWRLFSNSSRMYMAWPRQRYRWTHQSRESFRERLYRRLMWVSRRRGAVRGARARRTELGSWWTFLAAGGRGDWDRRSWWPSGAFGGRNASICCSRRWWWFRQLQRGLSLGVGAGWVGVPCPAVALRSDVSRLEGKSDLRMRTLAR